MREIKFRVWGLDYEYYRTINLMDMVNYEGYIEHIEQYTGLKDMNGIEIFEGDIIKVSHVELEETNYTGIGNVVFKELTWVIDELNDLWMLNNTHELEVIGNIHEEDK